MFLLPLQLLLYFFLFESSLKRNGLFILVNDHFVRLQLPILDFTLLQTVRLHERVSHAHTGTLQVLNFGNLAHFLLLDALDKYVLRSSCFGGISGEGALGYVGTQDIIRGLHAG